MSHGSFLFSILGRRESTRYVSSFIIGNIYQSSSSNVTVERSNCMSLTLETACTFLCCVSSSNVRIRMAMSDSETFKLALKIDLIFIKICKNLQHVGVEEGTDRALRHSRQCWRTIKPWRGKLMCRTHCELLSHCESQCSVNAVGLFHVTVGLFIPSSPQISTVIFESVKWTKYWEFSIAFL